MDLSGLSSFVGGLVPGYQKGQSLQADLATQQEQAKQMRLKTQEMLDDRQALAALGNAFGLNSPSPQGGGAPPAPPMQPPQAPMVTTSTGAPAGPPQMPPGAQYGAPPPPQGAAPPPPPQGAPPMPQQGMPPRPPMAPPPQAQQRPSQPPVPPQIAANLGQMSTDQLAQRIITANPGIKDRPDLLVRAMEKGQALLAPDAKATLAVMQLNQKAEQLQNKLDVQTMNDQTKLQVQTMVDNVKTQLEQFKQAGADKRQTDKLDKHISEVEQKIAAKHEDVGTVVEGRKDVAETQVAGRKDVAETSAGAKVAAQGVNQQYRSLGQQTAAINKRIQELFAGGKQLSDLKPEEKQLYDGLVKQRDNLAAKAKDLGDRAEKAGAGKMPKFADVVKEEGAKKPEGVTPLPGGTAPVAPAALPKDLPPPAGHAEGSTAKDKDGNVVAVIKNGAWASP